VCANTKALRFITTAYIDASEDVVKTAVNEEKMEWDDGIAWLDVRKVWKCNRQTCPDPTLYASSSENAAENAANNADHYYGEWMYLRYATKPALGGSISSRVFEEFRWVGAGVFICYDVNSVIEELHNVESYDVVVDDGDDDVYKCFRHCVDVSRGIKNTKEVKAVNVEASQYLSEETYNDKIYTKITMISCSEIGGWLPVKTINGATSGSLIKIMNDVTKYVDGGGGRGGEEDEEFHDCEG
jgi:hypothetical protein